MKKRVLVVSARYGSGHTKIAEYVADYIRENNKNVEVMFLDMTKYANKIGVFSIKTMDFVAKKRPEFLFGICYDIMNHRISNFGHNRFAKKCFDNEKLRNAIKDFNPDITISSHFYCSNIISYYNDLGITNTKLFTIITDYCTHELWTINHQKENGFIVANDIVKESVVEKGVDSRKVFAYGLPININDLLSLDNKENIISKYKLNKEKLTYLFFGGGSAGSLYYYDFFKALVNAKLDANIVFISGNNGKLKNKCMSYVKKKKAKNIKVLGFTNDVLNLMSISSLVISKPGGATLTESLEMKVPMLLIPGVGGQEKYNAKFIVRKKYGFKVRSKWKFKKILVMLTNNPAILDKMKNRLQKLKSNESAKKINDLINRV